jgi:hypothetical protein
MIDEPDNTRRKADACWAIKSPPLLHSLDNRFPASQWYTQLPLDDFDIVWPAPPDWSRFRLGIQFERLWQTALEAMPGYQLLASNLAVRDHQRTLGEFDLIVNHEGETQHWELAVKFYLGTADLTKPENWFGPSPEDRLDLKTNRLLNHQLLLAKSPEAKQLLATRNITPVKQVHCLVKGRLFYPWQSFTDQTRVFPVYANTSHLKGWWMSLPEFKHRFSKTSERWVYLSKYLWLSTITDANNLPVLNYLETLERLEVSPTPQAVHLAMIDDQGREISRGFVVSEQWINQTNSQSG